MSLILTVICEWI